MRRRTTRYKIFFFFNDTATTEIYTLSLHDALPICRRGDGVYGHLLGPSRCGNCTRNAGPRACDIDRKSTRLNSSHANISYAVFCLKQKSRQYLVCLLLIEKKKTRSECDGPCQYRSE